MAEGRESAEDDSPECRCNGTRRCRVSNRRTGGLGSRGQERSPVGVERAGTPFRLGPGAGTPLVVGCRAGATAPLLGRDATGGRSASLAKGSTARPQVGGPSGAWRGATAPNLLPFCFVTFLLPASAVGSPASLSDSPNPRPAKSCFRFVIASYVLASPCAETRAGAVMIALPLVTLTSAATWKGHAVKAPVNRHDFRESWLRAAAAELRPYFASVGYPLPDNIRFALAFTSTGRKGKRLGECWHSSSSGDATYEIFLRADLAEPVDVLGVLVKELVHTALPAGVGHGKLFKAAALKIGLQGPMRKARPGVLLQNRLTEVAAALGPLPHASLHIEQSPLTAVAVDRPKKQRARMLKAHCDADGCGYLVRVAGQQVKDIGPPHCPKHGPMTVEFPSETKDEPESGTEARESV